MDDNKSNLIVNYLPQGLSDHEFQSMFAALGTLSTCKIIRDKTGYSFGYGFVEYQNPQDALKAISILNGYHVQNKTIKVAFARPKGEESKTVNFTSKVFHQRFLKIFFIKLLPNLEKSYKSRIPKEGSGMQGVAFVLYSKHSEAQSAVQNLNNQIPQGFYEPLKVQFAIDDQHRKKPMYTPLPAGRGEPGLGPIRPPGNLNRMNRFNPMGGSGPSNRSYPPPQNPSFGGPPRGGMGRGGPQPGRGGPQSGRGGPQSGRGGYQSGRGGHQPNQFASLQGCVVFVYNIGPDATEDDMFQLFQPYGIIQKIDVVYDKLLGKCRGFGFVTLADQEQAKYAIECLDGTMYGNKKLQVRLKSEKENN